MNIEQFIAEMGSNRDKGHSIEENLVQLRSSGATQKDTVLALVAVFGYEKQEADRIVLTSNAWKDKNKRAEFFDSLDDEFD